MSRITLGVLALFCLVCGMGAGAVIRRLSIPEATEVAVAVEAGTVSSAEELRYLVRDTAAPVKETLPAYAKGCKNKPPPGIAEAILEAAQAYTVDPWMLAAIVQHESACAVRALGAQGEIGLTQVAPAWVPKLKEEGIVRSAQELYNVRNNVMAAAFILKTVSGNSKSRKEQFRRYNGSGAASRSYALHIEALYVKIKQ